MLSHPSGNPPAVPSIPENTAAPKMNTGKRHKPYLGFRRKSRVFMFVPNPWFAICTWSALDSRSPNFFQIIWHSTQAIHIKQYSKQQFCLNCSDRDPNKQFCSVSCAPFCTRNLLQEGLWDLNECVVQLGDLPKAPSSRFGKQINQSV